MKTQPTHFAPSGKTLNSLAALLFALFSLNCFSQSDDTAQSNKNLTTLQKVVDGIKEKNQSIKNEETVNVMVNDKLVEDLQNFTIDPKRIAMVEVLVLEPKNGSRERVVPSIIINTKR